MADYSAFSASLRLFLNNLVMIGPLSLLRERRSAIRLSIARIDFSIFLSPCFIIGTPKGTRTPNSRLRRTLLCPFELLGHSRKRYHFITADGGRTCFLGLTLPLATHPRAAPILLTPRVSRDYWLFW